MEHSSMEDSSFPFLHHKSPWIFSNFISYYRILCFMVVVVVVSGFVFLRNSFCCQCEICISYLRSSWAGEFKNLCDWHTHLLRDSKTQTVKIHVLGKIITSNPGVVDHVLKTNFKNYLKGKQFSTILGDLLGKGIFNVDGDLWAFQRKLASLELGSNRVRCYAIEIVNREIDERLLPILSLAATGNDGKAIVLNLQDVFQRFSFDNICNISFGLDPSCLKSSMPASDFAACFDLATKLSAERARAVWSLGWKVKRFLNIGSERKLRDAIKVVKAQAKDIILHKRSVGFSNHRDLLSSFMACVDDDEFLCDIVISFILAGRDTMASALTMLFWLLAAHPIVAWKIRREADEFGVREYVRIDQIKEMDYLHGAVYESLRLYPPVQFDSKFAVDDDTLPDGTFVNKGTRVMYHPYAMGRMKQIWGDDFAEYKPERWLQKGKFRPENPYNFPVFQAGHRVCLGKEMAVMEMKIVALSVLRKYDVKVLSPVADDLRFIPGLTAVVNGGVNVVVVKRGLLSCSRQSFATL